MMRSSVGSPALHKHTAATRPQVFILVLLKTNIESCHFAHIVLWPYAINVHYGSFKLILFWVRNLTLFLYLCKWDVTRYIDYLGIFPSIFKNFLFLNYFKRQYSDILLNYNHYSNKIPSLKPIRHLLIKIFLNIFEQPWMGMTIVLQVCQHFLAWTLNQWAWEGLRQWCKWRSIGWSRPNKRTFQQRV